MSQATQRFRLNFGRHVQDHPTERITRDGMTFPVDQLFCAGQVIESADDLTLHNGVQGALGDKFTKLSDGEGPDTVEFHERRIAELRERKARESVISGDPAAVPSGRKTYTEEEVKELQRLAVEDAARKGFNSVHADSGRTVPPPSPPPTSQPTPPSSPQERGAAKRLFPSLAQLSAMTVKQLQDLADAEEIDWKGESQRGKLVEILKPHCGK